MTGFVKHVLGKDSLPVFVFRKATSEVVYVANAYRLLIVLFFLKLENRRLNKQHKRLSAIVRNGNGRARV